MAYTIQLSNKVLCSSIKLFFGKCDLFIDCYNVFIYWYQIDIWQVSFYYVISYQIYIW